METREIINCGSNGKTEVSLGPPTGAVGIGVDTSNSHIGASAELRACAWLLDQGCEVFRNVRPHGAVDIVAIKDGKTYLFDVKNTLGKLTSAQAAFGVSLLIGDGNGGFRIEGVSELDWARSRSKMLQFKMKRRYPAK